MDYFVLLFEEAMWQPDDETDSPFNFPIQYADIEARLQYLGKHPGMREQRSGGLFCSKHRMSYKDYKGMSSS